MKLRWCQVCRLRSLHDDEDICPICEAELFLVEEELKG